MQLKRLLFAFLFLPVLGFCDSLTLSGGGTGSLVINSPASSVLSNFTFTDTQNNGVGSGAVDSITTGDQNNGFGSNALSAVAAGSFNNAVGDSALSINSAGSSNDAFGNQSLLNNTTDFNAGFGGNSLRQTTVGSSNTAMGENALLANTVGDRNTALGQGAGYGNASDDKNSTIDTNMTFLGFEATRSVGVLTTTPLRNSVALGAFSQVTASNTIQMGGTGTNSVTVVMTSATARTLSVSSNTFVPGTSFYASGPVVYTSSIQFSPSTIGIFGTQTNDNALGGYIGEYLSSSTTNALPPPSNNYGDAGTLPLTSGDWDVTVMGAWDSNGATWAGCEIGVGLASGNNSSGLTLGLSNQSSNFVSSAVTITRVAQTVSSVRISVNTPTTIYLKMLAIYTVGSPRFYGSITARRVR